MDEWAGRGGGRHEGDDADVEHLVDDEDDEEGEEEEESGGEFILTRLGMERGGGRGGADR